MARRRFASRPTARSGRRSGIASGSAWCQIGPVRWFPWGSEAAFVVAERVGGARRQLGGPWQAAHRH